MTRNRGRIASRTLVAGIALATIAAVPNAASAEDGPDDVSQLEKRIEDLEAQLREVQRGGYALGMDTELEARVAELEKNADYDGKGLIGSGGGGLEFHTADKKHKYQIGGRIMNDYTGWSSDSETEAVVGDELKTATEFRRARLFVAGTMNKNVEWKAQYDFAGGDADFKDVYLRFLNFLGMGGKLTVGHHHAPFGFEEKTSSKYISHMERSPLNEAFSPSRKTGASWGNSFKLGDDGADGAFRVGTFRDSDGYGDDTDNTSAGEWNFSGRVSVRPLVDDENETMLNLGASAMLSNYSDSEVRFRARPMVHTAPRFVDTGTIMADDGTTFGLDAAFKSGPFHAQAEMMTVSTNGPTGMEDYDFDGFHVSAGYFLTGESRPWKGDNWDRVKPKSNYGEGEGGGTGAWEVVAGYNTLDLSDGAAEGGELDVISIGLNWYLNPNTRIMFNYLDIDLDRDDADNVQAFQIRFQIDF